MLTAVDMVDGSEKTIHAKDLRDFSLTNTWLDAKDPTNEEIKAVAEKIDVSLNLIKPTEIPTYSTLHSLEERVIFYFSTFEGEFDIKDLHALAVVLSKSYVITIRREEIQAIEKAKQHLKTKEICSPSYTMYAILDEVIRVYFNYIETLESGASALEETILQNPHEGTLADILKLKAKLTSLNRLLWYQRGVLHTIKKSDMPLVTETTKRYLEELIDDLTKQIDSVSVLREVLEDAMNSYRASVTHQSNVRIEKLTDVMKLLTVLTVIMTIPVVISSHYGQNFPIPELKTVEAYYVVTGISVALILLAIFIFKKRGWI